MANEDAEMDEFYEVWKKISDSVENMFENHMFMPKQITSASNGRSITISFDSTNIVEISDTKN